LNIDKSFHPLSAKLTLADTVKKHE